MCDCIDKIESRFLNLPQTANTLLLTNLLGRRRAMVTTCKRDSNVRQKPIMLLATYCPFCGEKYEKPDGPFEAPN